MLQQEHDRTEPVRRTTALVSPEIHRRFGVHLNGILHIVDVIELRQQDGVFVMWISRDGGIWVRGDNAAHRREKTGGTQRGRHAEESVNECCRRRR